jgi:hypothetical protein
LGASDLHPTDPKPGSLGVPGLRQQGIDFLSGLAA